MECSGEYIECPGESPGNDCLGQAFCKLKGTDQNGNSCKGFCPIKCPEDKLECKQPNDPVSGCENEPICIDKALDENGIKCPDSQQHCPENCEDNAVACEGKPDVFGCKEPDTCVIRQPKQGANSTDELCPGVCPEYCDSEKEVKCESQIDPETGCKTQETCVLKQTNKQGEACPDNSASHGCPIECPKNHTLCPPQKTKLGCLEEQKCYPINYSTKTGKECPQKSNCPVVCETDEKSAPPWMEYDEDGCPRPKECYKVEPEVCLDQPVCPDCPLIFPGMGRCDKEKEIECPGERDAKLCRGPSFCIGRETKTKGNDVGGLCPAYCPAKCKSDEVLCPSREDCDGCKTAEVCKPKKKDTNGNFCPDDSASHECPVICNEEIGQVLCTAYENILGCKPKATCVTRMKATDGQYCPSSSVCPVQCAIDEIKCPDGDDELGCKRADCCIAMARDNLGEICPEQYCPQKCRAGEYFCAGLKDEITGCMGPSKCVANKIDQSTGFECPHLCPIACGPGEMSVFGQVDENGCLIENSCEKIGEKTERLIEYVRT